MRRIVLQCLLTLCCFGTFALGATRAEAATYTVTNTGDADTNGTCDEDGTGDGCTLREAITASNDTTGGNIINFAPSLMGTITLQSALPDITADVSIQGPGATEVTVTRDADADDFAIFVTDNVTASIDGLAIVGGAYDTTNNNRIAGGVEGNASDLTVSNCVLSNNAGYAGGGIAVQGDGTTGSTLTDDHCTFTGNTAEFAGGGILVLGSATISNSTISGNSTDGDTGGGIINYAGEVTINACTITGNTATSAGGGVFNNSADGTVDINDSFLAGNTAGVEGGAVDNFGIATSTNCTFVSNDAPYGGAIENDGGTYTLNFCTITDNSASQEGGGFDNYDAGSGVTLMAGNNIIALNDGDDDVSGDGNQTYNSLGYNLIGGSLTGADASFNATGDQTGVTSDQLKLGNPANNGGPTFTRALQEGSIAINAGNPDTTDFPDFDQRGEGFPRVSADIADAGAYEAQLFSLHGKVFNATALKGLSGIPVRAVRTGNTDPSSQVMTDVSGNYSLGLFPGEYTLSAGSTTFRVAATFTNPVTLGNADDPTSYNFRAIGIGGRVINPTNIGVSGVTINLYKGTSTTVASSQATDAQGFFSFDGLAAGPYTVTPTAPTTLAYSPTSRTLTVADSAIFTSFTASAKVFYSFAGRVTINNNGNAQGVPNATVRAVRSSDKAVFTAKTTVEGRYTLKSDDLTAGTYTITVSNAGFSTTPVTLATNRSTPAKTGINFTVKRLVTGIVYNAVALKGISGVTVSAVRRGDKAVFAVKTDGTGRYNSTLDVGTYDFSAVLTGNAGLRFNVTFASPVVVAAEVTKDTDDHNFRAVGVTGRVITDKNVGVSGITVKVYAASDTALKTPLFTGTTDSNGFFSIENTPDGNYTVVPTPTSTYTYAPVKQNVNVLGQAVFSSFTTRRK